MLLESAFLIDNPELSLSIRSMPPIPADAFSSQVAGHATEKVTKPGSFAVLRPTALRKGSMAPVPSILPPRIPLPFSCLSVLSPEHSQNHA